MEKTTIDKIEVNITKSVHITELYGVLILEDVWRSTYSNTKNKFRPNLNLFPQYIDNNVFSIFNMNSSLIVEGPSFKTPTIKYYDPKTGRKWESLPYHNQSIYMAYNIDIGCVHTIYFGSMWKNIFSENPKPSEETQTSCGYSMKTEKCVVILQGFKKYVAIHPRIYKYCGRCFVL